MRVESLLRLLFWDTKKGHFCLLGLFLALGVGYTVFWCHVGAPPISNNLGDSTYPNLDMLLRLQSGQQIHEDFYQPLGVFTFQLGLLGALTGSERLDAYAVGFSVFFATSLLAGWCIGASRLSVFWNGVFTLQTAFLSVAFVLLGDAHSMTTLGSSYNRLGTALLALFWLWAFVKPKAEYSRALVLVADVVAGICLGLAFFTKASYFLVALCGLLAAIVFLRVSLISLLVMLAGLALPFLVQELLFLKVTNYWADITMASSCRNLAVQLRAFINDGLGILAKSSLVFAAAVVAWPIRWTMVRSWIPLGILVVITLGLIGVQAVDSGYVQNVFLGLAILCAFYAYEDEKRFMSQKDCDDLCKYFAFALLAIAGFLLALGQDVTRSAYAAYTAAIPTPRDKSLPKPLGEYLPTLAPGRALQPWEMDELEEVASGVELLEPHHQAGEAVMSMTHQQPFNVIFGSAPPVGGAPFWHQNFSFCKASHPPDWAVFADVEWVLFHKATSAEHGLNQLYGHVLREYYTLVDENHTWQLYRKESFPAADIGE